MFPWLIYAVGPSQHYLSGYMPGIDPLGNNPSLQAYTSLVRSHLLREKFVFRRGTRNHTPGRPGAQSGCTLGV